MQITISGAMVVAAIAWIIGLTMSGFAAFGKWPPGWFGLALMPIGSAAWIQHRMHREANRLMLREDAAFDLGRASVRSIR